jgi:putative chitinase
MILKIGSTGEEVKKLQVKLGLSPDGSFGPGTEKAVKKWQIDNNLTSDGIVGDGTWSKMFINITSDTIGFKLDKLKGHIPDSVILQIPETSKKFNITTPLRLAHFLSQCGHESGGFTIVKENLNYSVDRMISIFKHDFDTNKDRIISESEKQKAKSLVGSPDKIGNFVYANQNGNGNEASGDGSKYKGRGYIQLTGKINYASFSKFIGEDCISNPDLVATKYPLASAAFFFDSNKLWSICDKGFDDATVTALTKRVNGGTIGLPDRIKHFKEFYNLLK